MVWVIPSNRLPFKSIVLTIPFNRQHPKSIVRLISFNRQHPKSIVRIISFNRQHPKTIVRIIAISRRPLKSIVYIIFILYDIISYNSSWAGQTEKYIAQQHVQLIDSHPNIGPLPRDMYFTFCFLRPTTLDTTHVVVFWWIKHDPMWYLVQQYFEYFIFYSVQNRYLQYHTPKSSNRVAGNISYV